MFGIVRKGVSDTPMSPVAGDGGQPRRASRVKVAPAKLEWEDLTYRVRDKQVLKSCTGIAQPGEVVALMGPSGAGKTSLLDLIARRIDPFRRGREVLGEVRLNDKKLTSRGFGKIAVYVQQEDALVGVLTVREVLFNAARLAGISTDKIDPMIERLGLVSAQDTIVGNIFMKGLSGGQKRRLSLAEQLLTEPSLLLLDEPTSGLDSASALAVIELLRQLAHSDGCTVLCTIHQPASEIWERFDKVRARGGGWWGGGGGEGGGGGVCARPLPSGQALCARARPEADAGRTPPTAHAAHTLASSPAPAVPPLPRPLALAGLLHGGRPRRLLRACGHGRRRLLLRAWLSMPTDGQPGGLHPRADQQGLPQPR